MNGQNKPLDNWDLEVLNKKDLQNETYFSFSGSESFNSYGASTLLRYGIANNYELQMTWTGTKLENPFGNVSRQSTRVGVKAFLNKDSKYLPGFSLIGSVNLTLEPENNSILPGVNILFRKGIASNFSLTGNYQFILDEQNGDIGSDFAVNLDITLTNWLTTYVGLKGSKTYPVPDAASTHQEYIELGMLFWLADGLRIYPLYDFGLAENTANKFSIGILYHFK